MSPKDLFSTQATGYAQFRPTYPTDFYDYLLSVVPHHGNLWDCATGNGQVALALADRFSKTYATDISTSQLAKAKPHPNVHYSTGSAEQNHFCDAFFDLITVAQALHWFDIGGFYAEVRRCLRPQGVLAVWAYGLFRINADIDPIIDHFYHHTLGSRYWDEARKHIDEEYRHIPFPFEQLENIPTFSMTQNWTLSDLEGMLNTWSAVQTYIAHHQYNPVTDLIARIQTLPNLPTTFAVRFPMYVKISVPQ